jgi:hypothetical protein
MPYLIGVGLAAGVSLLARYFGLDRDRAFYPTVLMVVASYYGLFAILGGSTEALMLESLIVVGFVVLAVVGFKFNLWLVAGALLGHGVFDLFHHHVITNPGVPAWWPPFCSSYDVAAGAILAWLLKRSRIQSKATP